ncbi:MAG: TonB-dependent receptor [Halioglobus sp.]|nr:TonB-dependent receptor [Halioglobus sp.]
MTYANVEFTDGSVPCTDPAQPPVGPGNRFNTCAADGETASAQPEWTGVLQSEYSWNDLVFGSDVYVSGLWSYKGDTEAPGDVEGRLDTESFSVLDLYAGLRNHRWSAQLFLKNAFDEDGVLSKRPLSGGYNEITVTPPQTVGPDRHIQFPRGRVAADWCRCPVGKCAPGTLSFGSGGGRASALARCAVMVAVRLSAEKSLRHP